MFEDIEELEPTDESHPSQPDLTEAEGNLNEEEPVEELPF